MDEAALELPRPIASYASREMASTSSCQIDGEWINDVRARVNLVQSMHHPKRSCTIFRVPEHIRRLDREAYEPLIVSLGPFHNGKLGCSFMECHKWQCVRHLLSRHPSPEHASQLLNQCLLELKKQDNNVRSCYSEALCLSTQEMALIMLLDGCFIIYLMLKMCPRKESLIKKERTKEKGIAKEIEKLAGEAREGEVVLNIDEKDELLDSPTVAGLFTMDVVVYDLLKLENQIPFFIIQLLFDHLKVCEDGQINLVDLALRLFGGIHPKESISFKKKSPGEYHHLLHLFYSSRIPSEKPVESTSAPGEAAPSQGASTSAPTSKSIPGCIELVKWRKAEVDPPRRSPTTAPKWFPSATELDRAGIKFERKEQADSFLNIKFQKRKIPPPLCLGKLFLMLRSGRMEIPPLQIYDYTGPLFRNLIAFEQCYFDTEMYITIYALFMDCIIDQAEDVQLLYLRGILEHGLSNDQTVADLINQLRSKIHHFPEKNYLLNQIEEVNSFYEVTCHKRVAALRRDYCSSPWATISVLAAAFLLLLTVEQAIFSAMSYVQPLQKG
ncbi:UPF0481 protein At3g47200-like [Phoenix dactylifera]|uniref:UPF0481 protein At3g47200-like n=1 Tax=Phoenix dactylifera TaxID=42345 RepID=A0A8B7BKT1_PHODC|nr:UPF0481 protein At3g47200-like [Phoenix dactylifera]